MYLFVIMKTFLFLILLFPSFVFSSTINNICAYPQSKLIINSKYVYAQNLCTHQDLKKGNKNEDNSNIKMFYVFEKEQNLPFWTKLINQPIDLIFLNSKLEVVSIYKNLAPNSSKIVKSNYPASFALQLEANQSTSLNIKVGQNITIENQ